MIPDVAYIQALLAEYDPRSELLRVARPGSGIANQVLFLTTTREDLVLRIYADDVKTWKPQKELAIYTHMAALGIPVPAVRKVDASGRAVPFTYSLSARMEGEPHSTVFASLSDANTAFMRRWASFWAGSTRRPSISSVISMPRLMVCASDRFTNWIPGEAGSPWVHSRRGARCTMRS